MSTTTSCGTGPPSPRSPAAWWPGPCACLRFRSARSGATTGAGFRVLVNWCRLVDLGASETGNLVCEVLDEGERALLWFAHRVGAVPHPRRRRPAGRQPADPRVDVAEADARRARPPRGHEHGRGTIRT